MFKEEWIELIKEIEEDISDIKNISVFAGQTEIKNAVLKALERQLVFNKAICEFIGVDIDGY